MIKIGYKAGQFYNKDGVRAVRTPGIPFNKWGEIVEVVDWREQPEKERKKSNRDGIWIKVKFDKKDLNITDSDRMIIGDNISSFGNDKNYFYIEAPYYFFDIKRSKK